MDAHIFFIEFEFSDLFISELDLKTKVEISDNGKSERLTEKAILETYVHQMLGNSMQALSCWGKVQISKGCTDKLAKITS